MNYYLHILVLINLYVVLAASLNVLAGYTGILSLCTAAFFGTGAYAGALLPLRLGWPWPVAVGVGVVVSALLAVLIGAASMRFRDDYFAITSFALQVILTSIMVNWVEVTQGPVGVAGIAPPVLFGWQVSSPADYLILTAVFAAVTMALLLRLVGSPYGRLLRIIREDEVLAQALGKNVAAAKVSAFVVGAVLTAIAGALYGPYISYIDPQSFTVHESIFILAIVIIGGAGSLWGTVFGAAFLTALPEALRFLDVAPNVTGSLQKILYGGLLAACMIWRPQGFFGRYGFQESPPA